MESKNIVELVSKTMKGIYNLGIDDFVDIMSSAAHLHSREEYENHFYRMRSDFFQWWCSVSDNVHEAFVGKIFR